MAVKASEALTHENGSSGGEEEEEELQRRIGQSNCPLSDEAMGVLHTALLSLNSHANLTHTYTFSSLFTLLLHELMILKTLIPPPQELPEYQRGDAVSSMVYEANARVRDPVYGCVGAISSLQQQVAELQTQLAVTQVEIVRLRMYQGSNPIHADRKGDIANAISPPVAPSSPSR